MEQRQSIGQRQTQSMGQNWDTEFEQMTQQMNDRLEEFNRRSPRSGFGCGAGNGAASVSGGGGRVERQPDGSLLFKATFDVHGYGPDDLKTSLVGDRTVRVSGRAVREQGGQQSSMSFDDQFTLPDGVDAGQLRSVVANGRLLISAPLNPPQYPAVQAPAAAAGQPQLHRQQQQQQQSQSSYQQSPATAAVAAASSASAVQRRHSPQRQQQQQQQQRPTATRNDGMYRLQVSVGSEFSAGDIRVSTDSEGRRLSVHARRQVKAAGKTSLREFRDEFDLPANVDVARLAARIRNDGVVLIDAPLLPEPQPGYECQPLSVVRD